MGTLRDPSTINNVGTLGGSTNPTTAQALSMERENQKAIRELVGAFGYEDLTISAGGITPTKAEVTVDTEAGASADDLTTIYLVSDGTTTLHDGMLLKLRAYDSARAVTVKHGSGVNQIQTVSGTDIVLGTTWELTLKLVGGVWKEVAGKPVIDITGNAATATSASTATTATTANALKQGGIIAPTSGGTSTAYTVTSSPVVSAYTAGHVYQFVAHTACGASPTVNFDGLGTKSIKQFNEGSKLALQPNDVPSGSLVSCVYDGTDMIVGMVSRRRGFSASKSTPQTNIAPSTLTKVTFDTEAWDSDGWYDNSTSIFQPDEPGVYHVTASLGVTEGVVDQYPVQAYIYKNGTVLALHSITGSGAVGVVSLIAVDIQMNGSTDYIEVYLRANGTGDKIIGSEGYTFFMAHKTH